MKDDAKFLLLCIVGLAIAAVGIVAACQWHDYAVTAKAFEQGYEQQYTAGQYGYRWVKSERK